MTPRLVPCLLLLAACSSQPEAAAPLPSPCREQRFEGSGFIVCTPASAAKLKLYAAGTGETAKRKFRLLWINPAKVAFAMNAGMFDEDGRPIGLAVVEGKSVHKIALRAGGGNFGMKPNGVFLVTKNGHAEIVVSEDYGDRADVRIATQSGPMLLIDGELHPRIKHDGESINIRNAVGIGENGEPQFVISADPVSFGKLARFFRDGLKAEDALYFDGSVSSLWDPANGRMDVITDLGPIIVAFR